MQAGRAAGADLKTGGAASHMPGRGGRLRACGRTAVQHPDGAVGGSRMKPGKVGFFSGKCAEFAVS